MNILSKPYKMPESKLRRKYKEIFKSMGLFAQNIESGSVEGGIPDMFLCYRTGHYWIEFKTTTKRANGKVRPKWQPAQIPWANKYNKRRGITGNWILIIAVGKEIYYSYEPKECYNMSELVEINKLLEELK